MSFKLKTAPAEEPVSLAEARLHLKMDDDTTEDSLITALISTAREYCESYTHRPLITQTWTYYADEFGCEIELKPNLQSISSVKYIDTDGVQQTVNTNNYVADIAALVGTVYPDHGVSWPSTRNSKNAVEIEFICGYGLAVDVPYSIKSAMKLLIGHWFVNREAVIVGVTVAEVPIAVDMLLAPYRVITF